MPQIPAARMIREVREEEGEESSWWVRRRKFRICQGVISSINVTSLSEGFCP